MAVVTGSGAPQVWKHLKLFPGFAARHPTQHEHFTDWAQAVASLQQFCFAHAAHTESPAAGGHAFPPLPVDAPVVAPDPALDEAAVDEAALDEAALDEAALDEAALDEAAEELPMPVQGAWQPPPTHCPKAVVVALGAPHWAKQPCGFAFGWAKQSVQQTQFGSAVQDW
jgi:hypothetical protein